MNALKCAATPGCGSQKRDSMLPEDYERAYALSETLTTQPADCDRQTAVDQSIQSLVGNDFIPAVQEKDEHGFPLLTTAKTSTADMPMENLPSWDMRRSYEELQTFNATWELDSVLPSEEGRQHEGQLDESDPFTSDPFDKSWHNMLSTACSPPTHDTDVVDQPNPITPDATDDWRELLPGGSMKPPIPENHKKAPEELDLALAREQGLSTSADSTMTMSTSSSSASKPNMEEIMENAKMRRARLEHAQNQLAREPPADDAVLQKEDVQHLMKRIDKLSKYLHDGEDNSAWETPSSVVTGHASSLSSTDIHYHDIADAPKALSGLLQAPAPSSPDRSLPPHIQPSLACPATTLRPLFWMSYPKRVVQSPLSPSPSVRVNHDSRPPEGTNVIENLPRIDTKMVVPTTSTASLVVLTSRRNSPGHSILRMPTVAPPTLAQQQQQKERQPPSNRSPAQQRIAVRAAVARLEGSLRHDQSTVVMSNKTVTFPGVPIKATLFENQCLDGISEDESNEWAADSKWESGESDLSQGESVRMAEI